MEQTRRARRIDVFVTIFGGLVLVAEAVLLFWIVFFSRPAEAAVFDNFNYDAVGRNLEASSRVGYAQFRIPLWSFSSSTLQLELTDVSLRFHDVQQPTATSTLTMHVQTDKGDWTSTVGKVSGYGYATTTFVFPFPHPYSTPGSTWTFWIDAPDEDALHQYWFAAYNTNTTSTDTFPEVKQYVNCVQPNTGAASCGDYTDLSVPPYWYVPEIIINASGTGALTITLPPNPADYGLTGTSTAQGQDLGFLGNMMRDVGEYLFTPNPGYLNYYDNAKADIQTRVPFGYFAEAQNAINTVSSTATTTALAAVIPTTWGNIPLFDSDDIKDNAGMMGVLGIVLFWERIFLWLALLFWIFERIRYLEI